MATSRLHELSAHGVSVWMDSLSREMLETGELARLMEEDAVVGVTSNPTIFQKALAEGDWYDEQLRVISRETEDPTEIFLALAQEDIRDACDLMAPVWERTNGVDGFVSLEVDPRLAYDRVATYDQAMRFHESEARPMGRGTAGVRGMNVSRGDNYVLAMDVAVDETELLVVTENGYGKRTRVGDYPAKGRGTMGVKTAQLTEGKGRLAGARIVREGYQVMLISDGGTVIRVPVDGIRRTGRATQGVIVMRLREGEQVATLAPVVGSEDEAGTDEPEAEVEAASEPAILAEGESAD